MNFEYPDRAFLQDPDRTPHNIQTVIKQLLGRKCNCSCGDPNFSIEEYRQHEEMEERDNLNGSVVESTIQSTLKTESNLMNCSKEKEKKNLLMKDGNVDGKNNDDDQVLLEKLLGGETLKQNGFPWSALIAVKGYVSVGGALITEKHVITSASALAGATASDVHVNVGAHDICVAGVTGLAVSVSEIHIHPSYLASDKRHDIAILTLTSKLTLNENISLVCLPSKDILTTNDSKIHKKGSILNGMNHYGLTTVFYCCFEGWLNVITLRMQRSPLGGSNPRKNPKYENFSMFNMLKYPMQGDRGTPVLIINKSNKFELFGIIMDDNFCTSPFPSQFIRVDLHIDWILTKIGSGCICKY